MQMNGMNELKGDPEDRLVLVESVKGVIAGIFPHANAPEHVP